ncbi:hypothetical protein IFR05_002906 [Cadophora sp. M221]|nr:hypothetical protein IFR05_002906 [Cadophora sp. M221]
MMIGIELGRSHSRAAIFRDHVFEIIVDKQGCSKIPSCVGFSEPGDPLVGFEAEDQAHDGPRTTIQDLSAVGRAAALAGLSVELLVSEARAAGIAYHTGSMTPRRGQGGDDVPDYSLICNVDEEWLTMTVEYSLRGAYRTVGLLEDNFRLRIDDENLSLDSEGIDSRIIALVERLLEMVDISRESITGIVVTGDSPYVDTVQVTLEGFFTAKKVLEDEIFGHDKAVVYEATSMAHRLSGNCGETFPYLMDVTFLDLGIRIQGDGFLKIISKDIPIPTVKTRAVTITTNNQGNIVFEIYQGQSLVASDNRHLGNIEIETISTGPEIEVEVEMLFQVDAYGILTVVGTEQKTRSRKETTFDISTTLDS